MQNGFVESFNGGLRDECLNEQPVHQPQGGTPDHRRMEDRLRWGARQVGRRSAS